MLWMLAATAVFVGGASVANAQQPKRTKMAASKDASGFAVVELFTSQGCNSCPSADENLDEITRQAAQKGEKVVTLSFHVDYWNYLGWKDPYSTADATKRQRLYAGVHGSKQVYTPQMVVNGTTELLGSSRDKSRAAIQSAIKKRPRSDIEIVSTTKGGEVAVEWQVQGMLAGDLLNVALVQNQAEDRVDSGENSGRTLRHTNVVRDFQVVNPAKEKGVLTLMIPEGLKANDLHLVAYVQSPMDASIHAVTVLDIE
jgi:hypothetical protein